MLERLDDFGKNLVNEAIRSLGDLDSLVQQGAEVLKPWHDEEYKALREALNMQLSMSRLVIARFNIARQVHQRPDVMDDYAVSQISSVLRQIPELLSLSYLQSLDQLISDGIYEVMCHPDGQARYIGFPSRDEYRALLANTERFKLLTYFLFAEVGLFSILWHLTSHENFAKFGEVKPDCVRQFLKALSSRYPANFREFQNQSQSFVWVASHERATCQQSARNIVGALECIESLVHRDC
jgi:hypothetical protein